MKTNTNKKIVILGMSDNPERYSHKAHLMLLENGFTNQVGISPKKIDINEISIVETLNDVEGDVHTLTLYVGAKRLETMIESILKLSPKRIITNPGTENQNLMARAKEQGIEVVEGCTLVMLRLDQF